MKANATRSRWRRTKPITCVIAITFCVIIAFSGSLVWQTWQRLRVQTASVKLTSSGNVIWGDAEMDMTLIEPDLKRFADLLRLHGIKPRLLIEGYRDTRDADIATLAHVGHTAGFDILDTQRHNWASPPTEDRPD